MEPLEPGTLYLVPTPIGNPDDITARAVDVLGRVHVVAAEDTRHARSLLAPLGIDTRVVSYHDHNERQRGPQLLDTLRAGQDVAMISDAGMPLVNDPGFRLVSAAIAAGVRVTPLPGPSATITALVGSGLPVHRFHYVGFLARKAAARRGELARLRGIDASLIFFEAPHRIVETLEDMRAVLGDRPAALARNLTKADEAFLRGTLAEVTGQLAAGDVRGQYTVVVGADPAAATDDANALATRLIEAMLRRGASARLTREVVQDVTGLPRNQVYQQVQLAEQDIEH